MIAFISQKDGGRENNPEKLNILLVVNDAVSNLNMKRHMSNTYNYLKTDLDAIELQGYNVVGSASYENILPIMTGYPTTDKSKLCPDRKTKLFDDCPLLWNEYKKHGYATFHMEDVAKKSVFQLYMNGFLRTYILGK